VSHESHVLEKGLDKSFEKGLVNLSIILPTFNEADNIVNVIGSLRKNLPEGLTTEILVVDDNSPDNTGRIAEEYGKHLCKDLTFSVKVIHRKTKTGLSSAIVRGMHSAKGETIVVMDSDFSHPPEAIRKMIEKLQSAECDIVVASRYVRGGSIIGWPFKRKIISKGATKIAQYGLGVKAIKDPMSGFFAFKRHIIEGIEFDAIGYKILLEILVKARNPNVEEVPYTFTNRRSGISKLDHAIIFDYVKAVWRLYRYGKQSQQKERRASVRFLSKAARFATIGATGLAVNYGASILSTTIFPSLWYLYSTIFGIAFSITSNFILNKIWTFEDKDFRLKKVIKQYGLFSGFSIFGAMIQLGILYLLIESYHTSYPLSLVVAVAVASIGNFLLNKKWTFNEHLWG
jgi:dolichol-phosphate mannosyltransferase